MKKAYLPAYNTPTFPLAPACMATPTNRTNAARIKDFRLPIAFASHAEVRAPKNEPAWMTDTIFEERFARTVASLLTRPYSLQSMVRTPPITPISKPKSIDAPQAFLVNIQLNCREDNLLQN
ncbi:hypothetical protein AWENTII_005925 [Aspergillus wentii]